MIDLSQLYSVNGPHYTISDLGWGFKKYKMYDFRDEDGDMIVSVFIREIDDFYVIEAEGDAIYGQRDYFTKKIRFYDRVDVDTWYEIDDDYCYRRLIEATECAPWERNSD